MKKGCLYWLVFGWWWEPVRFIFTYWWRRNSILINIFELLMLFGFLVIFGMFSVGIIVALAIIVGLIKLIRFIVTITLKAYQTYKSNNMLGKYEKNNHAQNFTCKTDDTLLQSGYSSQTTEDSISSSLSRDNKPAKESMSDDQALAYARMCNAYLEHQDEMNLYEGSK